MHRRWNAYWDEAIQPRFFLLQQLPLAGRGLVTLVAALNVVVGLLPVAFVVASSALIGRAPAAVANGLGSSQWHALVSAFLVASGVFFAQQVVTPFQSSLAQVVKHRVDGHFYDRMFAAVARSTSIAPLENQTSLAHLHQATESLLTGFRTPGDAAAGTLALIARYTRLIGFGVLIVTAVSWLPAVAICASTMLFRFGHRGGLRMYTRLWPTMSPLRRERDYFRALGLGAATAKEIRVFGLTAWLVERYRSSAVAALMPMWRTRRQVNVQRFLGYTVVGLIVSGAALAVMVRSAARGELTLTELLLGLQASIGALLLGEFYHEADAATQFGMLTARALDDFEKYVDDQVASEEHATGKADGLPTQDIHFADVSFTYPGSTRRVLDGLDLTLRAGECTAIVGLNGAGKTTLVKLLARLYEPTEGSLLVDGRDAQEFAVESWRRQIGVIFQDFNRYELSVADNIAFGAIETPADPVALRAAADKAGILAAVDELPRGLDTMLARQYDDGAELSGGQWQRVAIARALHAVDAGAKVLVLDEPTAALDVRAEAAFFDEFAERTRGVTTLLISHRFSSVRHADRIVVLAEGKLIEDGTHESLLAGGGRYADLFHMQAEQFSVPTTGNLQ